MQHANTQASNTEYDNLAITVALASSMNRPNCADNATASDWIMLVRKLLGYMQWPCDQWSFGEVSHVDNIRGGIVATITFVCGGISVTAEIGVFAPRQMGRVYLAFDPNHRVLTVDTVDFTSPNSPSLLDVIHNMKNKIHEQFVQTAWKSGNAARKK